MVDADPSICGAFWPEMIAICWPHVIYIPVWQSCRTHLLLEDLILQLLKLLEAKTGGQKCAVWARVGNAPAEHVYEKNQFQPDGWSSVVLRLGQDKGVLTL